ncbi:MAG: cation transporter, partial [Cyanobacteria bacterium P01_A01_bin.40]
MNTTTNLEKINLKLGGMGCAACANAIEEAISSVPGVAECNVNFGAEQARVSFDSSYTSIADIQNAVIKAGYSSTPFQLHQMLKEEKDLEQASR